MRKAEIYHWFGVAVGTVIVVALVLEGYKKWSLPNLVIIGAVAGATVGMAVDIIGKRDMFSNVVNGFIGNIIFGATIGAIWAPKIDSMISSIAGAITGAIAGILYSKIVHYFARNRAGIDVDAIFGMLIGAIYGALIVIIYSIYMIPFYRTENISIFDIIFGDEMIFGIILGAIIGTVFGGILGIIHFTIGGRGIVGGSVAGSIIMREIAYLITWLFPQQAIENWAFDPTFLSVISGVFVGAIMGVVGSKGIMKTMIAGITIGVSIGAFLGV